MCELLLSMIIVGFVNTGPNTYTIQGQDMDGNVIECEMIIFPKKNEINF